MEPTRPDPDKLLTQVNKQEKKRGKLKIFFGACAGVGKTYAMLLAAKEKINENCDVVAGIIETHHRVETEKLLESNPTLLELPLRQQLYQGILLKEFDLDAALTRKPDILLVDELAHTNISGSRHPKRWQDVKELLDSGIDVYTTLNVQHLESLNDIVSNITGIKVKETVSDSIFDHADEIVLVDIPSEIIIERLNEGKVYLGEFTKIRAAQNFFKLDNLIALREIALRRTAERVDALRDIYKKYRKGHKNPLLTDHILVCISSKVISTKLIRIAKQQASRLSCPWTAIYVENEKHYRLSKEEQLYVEKTLRLAEQLGGKKQILQKARTVDAIIEYVHEQGISRIILGKSSKPKWKRILFGSLVNQIIDKSEDVNISILTDTSPQPPAMPSLNAPFPWLTYFYIMIFVVICTLLSIPFKQWGQPQNAIMIYLVCITIISSKAERSAGFFATLLSVIAYQMVFVPNPVTHSGQTGITLATLFLSGIILSALTSHLYLRTLFAKQREKYSAELYALSRKLLMTPGKYKISKVAADHIGDALNSAITIWLPDHNGILALASHPNIQMELKEESVARWVFTHHQAAGLGTDTMPSARGYYLPLSNGEITFGVLGIIPKDHNRIFTIEETNMLEALSIQTALALERTKAAESKNQTTK